ncbi:MAG: hypothetical protein EOP86_22360 [Verrucomicrobiaceae bacterium]|nr:MAG: hypothetical protein EOP86_22360 [Verrucomicrobiaceae bacterium]
MITYGVARQIAIAHIGRECVLIESSIEEKSYGWFFQRQSRAFLESGDDGEMLIGESGFIVERENGRIVTFGSSPCIPWLELYEKSFFKFDRWDLTILRVHKFWQTVDLLASLQIQLVIPKEKNGTVWKIPRAWPRQQIERQLMKLPCVFYGQQMIRPNTIKVFDAIDASHCCEYQLAEACPQKHMSGCASSDCGPSVT